MVTQAISSGSSLESWRSSLCSCSSSVDVRTVHPVPSGVPHTRRWDSGPRRCYSPSAPGSLFLPFSRCRLGSWYKLRLLRTISSGDKRGILDTVPETYGYGPLSRQETASWTFQAGSSSDASGQWIVKQSDGLHLWIPHQALPIGISVLVRSVRTK